MLPSLVEAAARGIEGSRLTILNGSQGVNDMATGIAAQGMSIYSALRSAMAERTENGAAPAAPAAAEKEA